ncbi:hypothetical protein QJS04_geneDACA024657 [Acorus gramineus]|uniref:DCD domain-containing protein n=1 Tax=Acorus gramineus TaxID=55184 RepID=A0AAV8ZYL0_ACOGR|nr:hypothetical protein QJS04_geneDACA024657 [Acorus gramineus]
MGAGRKTQTFTISESVSSRGLSIKNLGGVIFGCKQSTMRECLLKQIFGLPSSHGSYVSNIRQGLPLFLFNYTDRKLHGIFEAASNGQLNIDPYCWTENGEEKTPYPAQVRIRISIECKSLDESQFRDVIADNYYTTSHFWFELDHAQVEGLKALFVPSLTESLVEQYLGSDNVIYLVGGFDGETWSSALDSYAPSHDVLTPLRPMSFARSYASAVALGGSLYVFGGRVGARYCRTVECYNPRKDEWILCTPLNREKGNLAGATLHNKIFAIGGGNAFGCFPDVEVFDPTLDRWINNQEMHQKRYGHGAAELNGALYVVGGCDGMDYLKTAERLDPRDPSWTKLPNMNSSRCSHSVAVLNDKLYDILIKLGPYNASQYS